MPTIINKKLEKERVNPLERHNFLSKEDAKTTFTYGLVAAGVLVAFYGKPF